MSERGTCTACGADLIWARSTATGSWLPLERATHLYRVAPLPGGGHEDAAVPVRDLDLFLSHVTRCPEPDQPHSRRRTRKLP